MRTTATRSISLPLVLLVLASGCPQRWDPDNPPGVSHGSGGETSGGEEAETEPTRPAPVVLATGDETLQGELADDDAVLEIDGTLYDELAFEAVEGASIVVTMRSAAFDPYLHLIGPDGNQIAHRGTPPGESTSTAELIVVAPASGQYRIYANALEPGMRGPYELRLVVEAPPRPHQ
jgi:hypothetical protein